MTDDFDPSEALASVRQTQNAVADRISRGGWLYDSAYSVLVAAMTGGWALPSPANYVVFSVSTMLLVVIARLWANHHGVWISGITPKRARWVAWGLGLAQIPLLMINLIWSHQAWPLWIPVLITAVSFGLAMRGSRLWRTVYRRENGLQP